ncbi:MAG TPA: ABC transporter ATP-binding protein [Solirubrobacterales bacterium]|jgi:spermidine/putrescine transport system ATP-binding protein|nr:ABC transporter ATP-binding protein [Solirubrobacterales bacterium]
MEMAAAAAETVPTIGGHGGGEVRLESLEKRFEDVIAVDSIDLEIGAGEFFSLLGPSGCGKTTTLRLIAGFERPTSGDVRLDGESLAAVPPDRRNVNTVFQSYALFPHLDVLANVAFGMRYQKVARKERERRAKEALELVELGDYAKRRPHQLSGGQQQRVALARALVLRPAVLLLDEPLGALDAKIRRQLRIELKALQEEVGTTFIFVTHDQEEALSMSDRIAVMHEGRVDQVGTPREIYEGPATLFVADFLGVANVMDVEVVTSDGRGCRLRVGTRELWAECGDLGATGAASAVVRPERLRVMPHGETGENCIPGMIDRTIYVGSNLQVMIRLANGGLLQASVPNDGDLASHEQGAPVTVHVPPDALRVLAPSGVTPAT